MHNGEGRLESLLALFDARLEERLGEMLEPFREARAEEHAGLWEAIEGIANLATDASSRSEQVLARLEARDGATDDGVARPRGSKEAVEGAMVERAVQANGAGDFFPVWGTCDGYEWIVEIFGGTLIKSGSFDSEDYPHTMDFTDAVKTSRIYASANASLLSWLANENITYNAHKAGVDPADPEVPKTFNVLATDVDRKGKPYIAQLEGKTLPIYANQFHPEKVQFVHNSRQPSIPRTEHAVAAARHLAQFFVSEAKKNKHGASLIIV
jgi:gamma-glutamyl hydrolase